MELGFEGCIVALLSCWIDGLLERGLHGLLDWLLDCWIVGLLD